MNSPAREPENSGDPRLQPVVKSLFAGHVPEETVFPYPEVSAEERETVSTFLVRQADLRRCRLK